MEIDSSRNSAHNQHVNCKMSIVVLLLLALGAISVFVAPAAAQGCAMCQTVLPHAAEPIARGMFWCVLLLLAAPFAVSASIGGWLFYQYWRHQQSAREQSLTTEVISLHPAKQNS
jgi:heme/copper-type cytochrome/quinol oxidase subunit 2